MVAPRYQLRTRATLTTWRARVLGDTISGLLYSIQSAVSGLQGGLTSLGGTIASDFAGVTSTLTSIQSSITGLTSTVTSDFSSVTSSLTAIQSAVTGLTTTVTNGFTTVESSLSGMSSSLSSIQTTLNSLSNSQTHSGLASSASGETTLSSSSPTAAIFTTPNGKVATVAVSVNATQSGAQSGSLTIRYYTDPSNPNLYVQQTVSLSQGGNNGEGYLGTGAAWKVMIVANIPSHASSTITADWAVSSTGPQ